MIISLSVKNSFGFFGLFLSQMVLQREMLPLEFSIVRKVYTILGPNDALA